MRVQRPRPFSAVPDAAPACLMRRDIGVTALVEGRYRLFGLLATQGSPLWRLPVLRPDYSADWEGGLFKPKFHLILTDVYHCSGGQVRAGNSRPPPRFETGTLR